MVQMMEKFILYRSECSNRPYQSIQLLNADELLNYQLPFPMYELYKYKGALSWDIFLEAYGDFYIEIRKIPIEEMPKNIVCSEAFYR